MNLFENEKIRSLGVKSAAKLVGVSFIVSVIIAVIVDDFLLSNLIVPSADTATLVEDINSNKGAFYIGSILYLAILLLDSIIAVGLYVVLKPAGKTLATITGNLRLLYVVTSVLILIAFAGELVEVITYEYFKLVAYAFFTGHIFAAGYTILKSKYIARLPGILLLIASFSYVIAFYLRLIVDIPEAVAIICMLFMLAGELSISIWLLMRAKILPQLIEANSFSS